MLLGKSPPSRRERTVSWGIMGMLGVIALGLYVKQSHYDPALFVPRVSESQAPGEIASTPAPPSDLGPFVPQDMRVFGPLESFGPETLSDKINGKAELYLSAGFFSLRCQRFSSNMDPRWWMEVFVYDMGTRRQAYAVYSMQRRGEAAPSDITPFSYDTGNALFFVHGRYYVEIIASVHSEAMTKAMLSFGKAFVLKTSVEVEPIKELALFPKDDLEEGSITLFIADAFGFSGLNNCFTARYQLAGRELTAFISKKEAPGEAARVVAAYEAFLMANGGTAIPLEARLMPGAFVDILDTFELIFHHGQYVAGIHEAETQEAAEGLAWRLKRQLAEAIQ